MHPLALYSGLVFATATAGGIIPLFVDQSKENWLKLFVSAGAGLLLGMAFLHMLPEAAEMLPGTFGLFFLIGFLILLILERFVMVHACEEHGCHYHTIGIAAFVGLAVHGIIEGLALGSSLLISDLGPLVLVGILSHKIPAGFALTSIMQLAKKSRTQIVLFAIGVGLTVPIGACAAYVLLEKAKVPSLAGALLSVSAGTFLYISACDLIPELHRNDSEKIKRLAFFLLGLFLAYVSGPLIHSLHHH